MNFFSLTLQVQDILKANRLWNRVSLYSKSIIKIPINEYNKHLYGSQSTKEAAETRGGDTLTDGAVEQSRSSTEPSSEVGQGVKRISNLLEDADDELAKAQAFQSKLASRRLPADGYNREPVEVTYLAQEQLAGR